MKKEIALYDVDSKIPNLALMKLSAWHKKQGDNVELYFPLKSYDKVYASQIFTWSKPLYHYDVLGGSGTEKWDIILPEEVEHIMPNYELYHNMDYALGFTTRGCIRKCPFCIVPQKEGKIKPVADIYDIWDKKRKDIVLLDNNILGLQEHFFKITNQIKKEKLRVDFNQGLDCRLLTEKIAKELSEIKHMVYRFSFDFMETEIFVRKAIKLLTKNKISRCLWYVLVGFNTTLEEDLYRLNLLKDLNQLAFVQKYNKTEDRKYIPLARWANQHHIFRGMTFEQFLDRQENKKYKDICL